MYHCVILELNPPQPATEIFIAGLAEIGFESFEETETGLRAYIRSLDWDLNAFEECRIGRFQIAPYPILFLKLKPRIGMLYGSLPTNPFNWIIDAW